MIDKEQRLLQAIITCLTNNQLSLVNVAHLLALKSLVADLTMICYLSPDVLILSSLLKLMYCIATNM